MSSATSKPAKHMTKSEIVLALAEKTELTKKQVSGLLEELAGLVARHSPLAVRMAKEEVRMSFEKPLDESLSLERKMLLFQSDDRREGVRAFVEKRPPRWTGK